MKRIKDFSVLAACFLALCFVLASCNGPIGSTQGASVTFTNSSTFSEDSTIKVELVKSADETVIGSRDVDMGRSYTWSDLTEGETFYLRVTDGRGKTYISSYFLVYTGDSRSYEYDGTGVNAR